MTTTLAFLSGTEMLVVAGVIVLLFGANKIPQLMRSMGSGISQFKKGIKEGEQDAEDEAKPDGEPPAPEKK